MVAKIRGLIRAPYQARGEKPTKRQLRVGHTGTLDPFATGLLIILLGDATKRSDEFLKLDKVYEATIRLGATSSTGDPEGEITETLDVRRKTLDEVNEALEQLVGEIKQIPPVYSAMKVGGQRAYKLARAGQAVDMPSRQVMIYSIELLDYIYPDVTIRAHVGSGTYIRTLAEDIGKALGTDAYCAALRRTRVGEYNVQDAHTLPLSPDVIE